MSKRTVLVPTEIRRRVEQRAKQCIALAATHFKREYQPVNISYTLRGTTAGTFQPGTREVNFNSILLMENVDDFIYRTVAHEVAHYIHDVNTAANADGESLRYFGHYMQTGRRRKRDIHGVGWQQIMVLFGAPISRTHHYDVSNAKIKRTTHKVKCTGCGTVIEISTQRYNKIARGARMWITGHSACGYLVPVTSTVKPTVPVVAPRAVTKTTTVSKLDRCKELYKKYFGSSRTAIIREFIMQADCTPAGAATYYAKCALLYGR